MLDQTNNQPTTDQVPLQNQTTETPNQETPTAPDITSIVTSRFWVVELRGTGLSTRKPYKEGAETIARSTGGKAKAFAAGLKLFPEGYHQEVNTVEKAFRAVREHFNTSTLPWGTSPGEGREASGQRLLAASQHFDGKFLAEHTRLRQDLDQAKQDFRAAYPALLQRIAAEQPLGTAVDMSAYPTLQDIDAAWDYELIGPLPLADSRNLRDRAIPLPPSALAALQRRMEAHVESTTEQALQSLALRTLEGLEQLSARLSDLEQYQRTPDEDKGRKPRFTPAAILKLREQATLLKAYALPGTEVGDKFTALADKIEHALVPEGITPKTFASSSQHTTRTKLAAEEMIESVKALQITY